jgi:hypothetical protein
LSAKWCIRTAIEATWAALSRLPDTEDKATAVAVLVARVSRERERPEEVKRVH